MGMGGPIKDAHPNLGCWAPCMLPRVQLRGCASVSPQFCPNMEKEKNRCLNTYTVGIYIFLNRCTLGTYMHIHTYVIIYLHTYIYVYICIKFRIDYTAYMERSPKYIINWQKVNIYNIPSLGNIGGDIILYIRVVYAEIIPRRINKKPQGGELGGWETGMGRRVLSRVCPIESFAMHILSVQNSKFL